MTELENLLEELKSLEAEVTTQVVDEKVYIYCYKDFGNFFSKGMWYEIFKVVAGRVIHATTNRGPDVKIGMLDCFLKDESEVVPFSLDIVGGMPKVEKVIEHLDLKPIFEGQNALEAVKKLYQPKTTIGGTPTFILTQQKIAENGLKGNLALVFALQNVFEDFSNISVANLLEVVDEVVVNAILCLTKKPKQANEDYLLGITSNEYALIVKMISLRDVLDLSQYDELDRKTMNQVKKAHEDYLFLKSYGSY
jgi:hypothetical protein